MLALALALPSALGLILLREPIFAALFSWNDAIFGDAAVQACAHALFYFALGLVPITVSRICVNLCIAHENTRSPARGAVVSLTVNVIASLLLIGSLQSDRLPEIFLRWQNAWVLADLGYAGIAFASSIAAAANALFLGSVVWRRYRGALGSDLLSRMLRVGLAAAAMGIVLYALPSLPAQNDVLTIVRLFGRVVLGAGVYFLALAVLRSPERHAFIALLRRAR